MADYHSPTVVTPDIPRTAITALEFAALAGMFECDVNGDACTFHSSEGPSEWVCLDVADVKAMIEDETHVPSRTADFVRDKLHRVGTDQTGIELDFSEHDAAVIFQDIVRRCDGLDHVTITAAWTCTKMRADGFGGSVTVITADDILANSTSEMEHRLLDLAQYGDIAAAPGHGEHRVLTLAEGAVRETLVAIQQAYTDSGVAVVAVSDEHLRAGCREAIATSNLTEYRQNLEFSAAMAAMRVAHSTSA